TQSVAYRHAPGLETLVRTVSLRWFERPDLVRLRNPPRWRPSGAAVRMAGPARRRTAGGRFRPAVAADARGASEGRFCRAGRGRPADRRGGPLDRRSGVRQCLEFRSAGQSLGPALPVYRGGLFTGYDRPGEAVLCRAAVRGGGRPAPPVRGPRLRHLAAGSDPKALAG